MSQGYTYRPCDVCLILDGDQSNKRCFYCSLCDKYICDACRPNLVRRADAARRVMDNPVLSFVNRIRAAWRQRGVAS